MHHETGIGGCTKEMFINRFEMYADSSCSPHIVKSREMQTITPWQMYAGMSEGDLGTIYEYLRTMDPAENQVVKFTPVTEIRIAGGLQESRPKRSL